MTIIQRDQVRAAVERALTLDPHGGVESAIASAAAALCIPIEAVEDAVLGGEQDQQPDQRIAA